MATKRKDDIDESYNSAFNTKKPKRLSDSYTKEKDLDALGIFYNETFTPVDKFMNMLQKEMLRTDFPEEAKCFIGLTKEHLTFSLDLDKIPEINVGAGPAVAERKITSYLEDSSRHLEKLLETYTFGTDDHLKQRLFSEWLVSTGKFLELTLDMVKLHILYKSSNVDEPGSSCSTSQKKENLFEVPEAVYSDVFSRFSEIFFLLPTYGRKTTMNDNTSGCVPGICYYQYTNTAIKHPVLLLHYEVKKDPSEKPEEESNEIRKHLSKKVLGQVGIELVSQCFNLAFIPNVLGIICMQTEIAFVYLTITADHVSAIYNSEDVNQQRAHIYYTEMFDIMKSEDRTKIIEMLFWLGCAQKCNLRRYYLKT